MNFKRGQAYSLRFFFTNIVSKEINLQEIITSFPKIMIHRVFEDIEEGFVVIKQVSTPLKT